MHAAPDTKYLAGWFARHRSAGRSARRLADGERFAGWEVLGLLGRGGSGEVYRARSADGAVVALKVLRADRSDLAARMRREAEVLAAHPHPALPRLLSSGEEKGLPYLVLEKLAPRDLPSRDRDVARLMLALCDGVAHLHRLGFVHRDIKPGNLLFRADGSPVLIDLGLVKDLAEEEAAPTGDSPSVVSGAAVGVGTPGYSAPEQFAGGKITPSADVYALGMLADACFSHRPPRCWRALLSRATSALEAERPASAAAFARAVRRRHLPGVPSSVAAAAAAVAAAVALSALFRPAPGNGPWRLSFPEGNADPFWNATVSDGNWKLAAYAEDGVVRIKPDYSHGDGLLDLSKPVSDGRGKKWKIVSIGFPPLARDNPVLSHGEVRLVGEVKGVLLPDGLVELGEGALMNCGHVEEIGLPASLRRIGPWAFSGCRGLRRIAIPADVEAVSDDRTFMGCSSLAEIAVAEGNGEYRAVDGVLLSADGRRLVAYPPGRAAARYDVPEGVEAIPAHLFVDCPNLAEVSIPPSVRTVGHHAFAGCRALADVSVAAGARIRWEGDPFAGTGVRAVRRRADPR